MVKKPKDFAVILERITTAEDWRDSVYVEKWKSYLRQYRSKYANAASDHSHVFIPQTFMQVETVKSRTYESLFTNRPYITIMPRGREDKEKADAVQALLDWQICERMHLPAVFADCLLTDALVFGTSVVFTGWLRKERMQKHRATVQRLLLDDMGMPFLDEMGAPISMDIKEIVEEPLMVYDDPVVQRIDLFDFFVDKTATTIQDARFCGHTEWLTKEQIQNLEAVAGWSVNWKNLSPVAYVKGGKEIRAELNGGSIEPVDDCFDKKSAGSIYEVKQYWEDNRHVVIINGEECALDEPNPFWHGMKPYDKCCYVPLVNEFYGIGIPEVLGDLQDELNTIRNQRIDYNNFCLRRMWKIRKGCGLTNKDLKWRQGGVIQVQDMDDVQEISVEKVPASAFTNEEVIKSDMKYATGVHDIVLGLSESDETATTTMTKDNNASIRFKFFIEELVDNILLPVARKCISMDEQYLEEDRLIRLFDNDQGYLDQFTSISPEDLEGEYDFYYVGSSVEPMANKEAYKQKMVEVYQLAMSNPLMQQNLEAQQKLLLELFRAVEVKDPQSLVPELPMQQPMMMQAPPTGNPMQELGINTSEV